MYILKTLFWLLLAYIIGSIPWALIIGKTFYNKDIREYGSHNLGGTNAGRVLGTHIGIIVIILDASKALVFMLLCNNYVHDLLPYLGLLVCIGHCFPVFAQFKGGKAVATSYGYLLGIALIYYQNFYIFLIPFIVFLVILISTRYMALASMIGVFSSSVYMYFIDIKNAIALLLLAIFVTIRHKSNIVRLINKQEHKIFDQK